MRILNNSITNREAEQLLVISTNIDEDNPKWENLCFSVHELALVRNNMKLMTSRFSSQGCCTSQGYKVHHQ